MVERYRQSARKALLHQEPEQPIVSYAMRQLAALQHEGLPWAVPPLSEFWTSAAPLASTFMH